MLADLIETWTTEPTKRKWLLNYLPITLSIILISFIAMQIANLFWAWKAPAPVPSIPVQTITDAGTSQTDSKKYDLGKIKQANLFGEYKAEVVQEVIEDTIDAPETTLKLNLHGTLLSDDQEKSRAIIEVNGKDTVFSIGDEIQSNVSLHSVLAYQVVLNNRGKKEILKLPREDSEGNRTPNRGTPSKRTAAANRIAQNIRTTALNNPSSITDILRLKKGQTSTGQKGFRIYPGKERERFRELGLMSGDFVTQVNGMPVAEQNPFQVIQTLSTSSYINFSIERNGKPMNLSFDLSQTQ